jgi:hypothetical protein
MQMTLVGLWILTTIVVLFAIFRYNLGVAKRKCQSWDGTKTFLLYSNIGNLWGQKPPSYQVTQNREGLLASEDYQIILRQARVVYIEWIAAALALFAAFAAIIRRFT